MKFVEDYCIAYNNSSSIYGYRIRDLFKKVSIYIMPMVNPDGVDLVTGYYSPTSSIYRSLKISPLLSPIFLFLQVGNRILTA